MKEVLYDAWTLALKEINQLYRDRATLALTFIVPILMVSALGFALVGPSGGTALTFAMIGPSGGTSDTSTSIALVDDDHTQQSHDFHDSLKQVRTLKTIVESATREEAESLVQRGQVPGALIIPEGFGHHLKTEGRTFVILFTDNSKHFAPSFVRTAVAEAIQIFSRGLHGDQGTELFQISIDVRTLTGRAPGGWAYMPGLLAVAITISSFDDVVIAISRERERGTLIRLTLTPINLISLYLGKTLSTVLLTIARTTEMLLVFVVFFSVPIIGSLALVYLVTIMIAITTLALGFALSTRLRGETTITFVEIIATFPLFALTGALFPIQIMSASGQRVAWYLPWTYGVDALRRVITLGQGLFDISFDISMLLLATAIFMVLAIVMFERRI